MLFVSVKGAQAQEIEPLGLINKSYKADIIEHLGANKDGVFELAKPIGEWYVERYNDKDGSFINSVKF